MESKDTPVYFSLPDDDTMDLKRYISLFLSNWYWFAVTLFIALCFAYGINRYSEKIYTVSSTLLIKDSQINGASNNVATVIPGGDIFRNQQNLNNEIGILKSYRLNSRVMRKLNDFHVVYISVGRRGIVKSLMYRTCPFIVVYDSLSLQSGSPVSIKILSNDNYRIELNDRSNLSEELAFGERFNKYGYDFTINKRFPEIDIYDPKSSNKFIFSFIDPEILASQYRGSLSVAPIEQEASIVSLSVSGSVPDQAADYLNALMEIYIDYGLEIKNQTADSTIMFIDAQLKIISDSLSEAEDGLEKFRLANSFFSLSSEGTIVQSRLEKLENEKAIYELQLQYYNYLSEYVELKHPIESIISPSVIGITDPVLIKLVNDLPAFQKEKEKLGFNLEKNQPAIELMEKQFEDLKEGLKENIKNGISSLNLSLDESKRKIDIVKNEVNLLPTIERKYIQIQRNFNLNNTVYTYLLEKRAESGIAKASNVSDNRIIDMASPLNAGQIRPRTSSNYMIAIMMGLLVPIIMLVLIDYFNDRVIDKRDVEKKTKVPVIGYISHNDGKSEIPVIEKPKSSLAESFRAVRTSMKYYLKENEASVIAISSTISSEGKTFISINLAAITALLGKKVLLVGLDLRKPRINKVFEFEDSTGMSTFLSGNCTFKEIVKPTQIKNLFYTPSGQIPPNPAELIETKAMSEFIDLAKKEFDFIIIDTPPVGIVTDALLLSRYVNMNIFIVRQRYTSRNTLEMIEQLRGNGELKNMAIVINDISLSGYYGYGMKYGSSRGYGYSYGYNYYGNGYYGRYDKKEKSKSYYIEED
jgi:tyrosine-protein kinase Etk/Wzc